MIRTWECSKGQYATGHDYRVGTKATIVGTTHRAIGSKSDPDAPLWVASIKLPGIKQAHDHFKTEEDAMHDVEYRVTTWFEWMGIEA